VAEPRFLADADLCQGIPTLGHPMFATEGVRGATRRVSGPRAGPLLLCILAGVKLDATRGSRDPCEIDSACWFFRDKRVTGCSNRDSLRPMVPAAEGQGEEGASLPSGENDSFVDVLGRRVVLQT